MKVELTKDEINLLDSVLTNELIRVEFPNGEQKIFETKKRDWNIKYYLTYLEK